MSVWNLVEFSSTTNLPLLYYVAILYAFGINIFRVVPADAIFSLWDGTPRTPLLRRKTFLKWKTAPSMTHKSSFNKFFFQTSRIFFFLFQIPNSNTLFALLPASSNCWRSKVCTSSQIHSKCKEQNGPSRMAQKYPILLS